MKRIPIPTRTREAVAACSALGLSYWADSPVNGHVWAANPETGTYSLVRVERTARRANEVGVFNGLTPEEITMLGDPYAKLAAQSRTGSPYRGAWLTEQGVDKTSVPFTPLAAQWQLGVDA